MVFLVSIVLSLNSRDRYTVLNLHHHMEIHVQYQGHGKYLRLWVNHSSYKFSATLWPVSHSQNFYKMYSIVTCIYEEVGCASVYITG